MAITKILNINAEDGRNQATYLKAAIDYIQNQIRQNVVIWRGALIVPRIPHLNR